jgi:glucan phosphoethanolaminetransferase (alkaline phosphatase superfamily)
MQTENKENRKYTSRKFIVWIVATIFEIGTLILAFMTKDFTLATQFTNYWGAISMCYIGVNVAQDFITQKKGVNE